MKNILTDQLKKEIDIRPGDTVRIHQKIKEKNKDRIQVFEGIVIVKRKNKDISTTITVRRVIAGIGVEKIFPVHSPMIDKIEVVKRSKVRRAKLYYLRTAKGRKARLKKKDFTPTIVEEEPKTKKPEQEQELEEEEKPKTEKAKPAEEKETVKAEPKEVKEEK